MIFMQNGINRLKPVNESTAMNRVSWRLVTLMMFITGSMAGCEKPDQEKLRQRLHLPSPGFVADAVKGEQLFNTYCASCHGESAKGSDQGPPLVHKTYRPVHHADQAFHWAVINGARQHHWHFGNMPPIPDLSPKDVEHILSYVRQEQRQAGIR